MYWDLFILLLLCYTVIATPIEIAFTQPPLELAALFRYTSWTDANRGSGDEMSMYKNFLRIPPLVSNVFFHVHCMTEYLT
jgi:hypothetical protein|tara:strand:+ start:15 stop:254 length:240 start_codon:yes stop_codon:yes gene_type:complete